MEIVDGDLITQRLSGLSVAWKTLPKGFPKGHWIVFLQPAIPRFGPITIMAFSKQNQALVYFGSTHVHG